MSGDTITIVSGLPRSGTSLMMSMLESGGMELLIDGIRTPDDDNPKGYYEFDRVKKLPIREWGDMLVAGIPLGAGDLAGGSAGRAAADLGIADDPDPLAQHDVEPTLGEHLRKRQVPMEERVLLRQRAEMAEREQRALAEAMHQALLGEDPARGNQGFSERRKIFLHRAPLDCGVFPL